MKIANKAILLLIFSVYTSIQPFRFVVYADSRLPKFNTSIFNSAVLGYINSQIVALDPKPDFVFFLGDMVNRGTPDYVQSTFPDWLSFMQSGLGNIPIYTAIGNTDLYGPSYGSLFTEYPVQALYQAVFSYLPNNGPADYKYLAYSFEFGEGKNRTLFVVLDSFGFTNVNGTWVGFDNGYDTEQTDWFAQQASSSTAPHKFVLTHGPAFSVEGFPVDSSVNNIWNIAVENNFDMFYCAHEHIYSRWLINQTQTNRRIKSNIQSIAGSAGATPDNASNVKVDPNQAHIYSGYTFIVVDIEQGNFVHHAYKVIPNGSSFITQDLDKLFILSNQNI